MKKVTVAVAGLLLFSACSKDKTTTDTACQTGNYGVVTFKFGATTNRHDIIITQSSNSTLYRDKIVATGTASDTVHIAPGSYVFSVSAIDDNGLALGNPDNRNQEVAACDNSTVTVSF